MPMTCPPRFGTRRSPDRLTLGPKVAAVAARLGKPFMPWQRYVADVVMEIDPETGRLAYDKWGLTVPRQSGKSTFTEAKAVHRCSATGFFGERQHVVYTAQTRLKAREKWEEDFAADLEASPAFRRRIQVHKGNGNEHIRFSNGSRFGLEASTEKAGHGSTLDEAYLDEAFAHQDYRLEQAFEPAMITRANKQLGWLSTAGWLDGSPYLLDQVEIGRALVTGGRRRGYAFFDWSAPEGADAGDEGVWLECMPAVCPDPPCRCGAGQWRHTITLEAIRAVYEKAVDSGRVNDFRRAYLNQWVPKDVEADWMVIGQDAWGAAAAQ